MLLTDEWEGGTGHHDCEDQCMLPTDVWPSLMTDEDPRWDPND